MERGSSVHEVGLVEQIVAAVERRAGGRPVGAVRVRIGALHRAHTGPMELAFELVGAGTVVDGARLEQVEVPVVTTCRACGHVEQGPDRLPYCAGCDGLDVEHAGGDELTLESIEYRTGGGAPDGSNATRAEGTARGLARIDDRDDDDDDPVDRRTAVRVERGG